MKLLTLSLIFLVLISSYSFALECYGREVFCNDFSSDVNSVITFDWQNNASTSWTSSNGGSVRISGASDSGGGYIKFINLSINRSVVAYIKDTLDDEYPDSFHVIGTHFILINKTFTNGSNIYQSLENNSVILSNLIYNQYGSGYCLPDYVEGLYDSIGCLNSTQGHYYLLNLTRITDTELLFKSKDLNNSADYNITLNINSNYYVGIIGIAAGSSNPWLVDTLFYKMEQLNNTISPQLSIIFKNLSGVTKDSFDLITDPIRVFGNLTDQSGNSIIYGICYLQYTFDRYPVYVNDNEITICDSGCDYTNLFVNVTNLIVPSPNGQADIWLFDACIDGIPEAELNYSRCGDTCTRIISPTTIPRCNSQGYVTVRRSLNSACRLRNYDYVDLSYHSLTNAKLNVKSFNIWRRADSYNSLMIYNSTTKLYEINKSIYLENPQPSSKKSYKINCTNYIVKARNVTNLDESKKIWFKNFYIDWFNYTDGNFYPDYTFKIPIEVHGITKLYYYYNLSSNIQQFQIELGQNELAPLSGKTWNYTIINRSNGQKFVTYSLSQDQQVGYGIAGKANAFLPFFVPLGQYNVSVWLYDAYNNKIFDSILVDVFDGKCPENWIATFVNGSCINKYITERKRYNDNSSCLTSFDLPLDNNTIVNTYFCGTIVQRYTASDIPKIGVDVFGTGAAEIKTWVPILILALAGLAFSIVIAIMIGKLR